jgi:biotin carboxyl carrier protein
MRYFVTMPSGREIAVEVTMKPTGELAVDVGGRPLEVDCVEPGGAVNIRVDGRVMDLWTEGAPPDVGIVVGEHRFYAKVESERTRALAAVVGGKAHSGEGLVKSPMPGRVLKVLVAEGDEVVAGAPLVVVEAMKMENELAATRSGKVSRVFVKVGATVEGGAKLVEIQ